MNTCPPPLRFLPLLLAVLLATGCGPGSPDEGATDDVAGAVAARAPWRGEAPLPDPTDWGTHILAVATAPDGAVWVGTYGQGIYVSRDGSGTDWENLRSSEDTTSISWDFVNAFAFAPGEVWYGTVGNGWGLSRDGGATWENWTFSKLGPRWQYVAPDGIEAAGDTIYIATADGLRITADDGAGYTDLTDHNGLANKYLLGLSVAVERGTDAVPGVDPPSGAAPEIRVRHLRGISESIDGGRSWELVEPMTGEEARFARTAAGGEAGSGVCPETSPLVTRLCRYRQQFRNYPDPGGAAAEPSERAHFWFRRPILPADNPRLDQTYTYGSTMGGNFQQHQGVEFNDPAGTPVHAIGDGVVAFAGQAEAGANTVAILHDRRLGDDYVWSTYYHNTDLTVQAGDTVRAGDVIAHVGNTGRATNDHLHLEIHTTPGRDSSSVVDADVRYPPYTRNPQLWIGPLPGTGAIAGRVLDAAGDPVPGARVYGVTKPAPEETPFSFAETYEDRAHPDPLFGENFAIGDVPAGTWVLGVEIEGRRVWRKVRVDAGKVTEVEFRPEG